MCFTVWVNIFLALFPCLCLMQPPSWQLSLMDHPSPKGLPWLTGASQRLHTCAGVTLPDTSQLTQPLKIQQTFWAITAIFQTGLIKSAVSQIWPGPAPAPLWGSPWRSCRSGGYFPSGCGRRDWGCLHIAHRLVLLPLVPKHPQISIHPAGL